MNSLFESLYRKFSMELPIKSRKNIMFEKKEKCYMMYQLDFLEEEKSEIEILKNEIVVVRDSNEKVRKSMFARHAELAKKHMELHERMQIIERNICRGDVK